MQFLAVNLGGSICSEKGGSISAKSPHKVSIQVNYYKSLSRFNNPSNPVSVTGLKYVVDDNGSYTIPAADLQRFPETSYVSITISRATDYTASETRTVVEYVAIITGYTAPILIQN